MNIGSSGTATFNITSTANVVVYALNIASGGLLNVFSGGLLTLGAVDADGTIQVNTGAIVLITDSSFVHTLTIDNGSVTLQDNWSATLKVIDLTINTGNGSFLDITNNYLISEYGTNGSSLAAIRGSIRMGRGGTDFGNAPWNGLGIDSST